MTGIQSNQQPSGSGTASGASRRASDGPLVRPLGDVSSGSADPNHAKPRVKMLSTNGDLSPAGASYTPPLTAPLPERGAGVQLLLSAMAALLAIVFLFLLAQKL